MKDDAIQNLFGTVPYFADTVIESMTQEADKRDFIRLYSWCRAGSVNLHRVVGTMHPDYAGMTWRELLARGRRMDHNLQLFRENPAYYTEPQERRPSLHIALIDGKGYVTDDGNHRTCIGRFYLYGQPVPFLHGVHLSEQYTDTRLMALHDRLIQLLPANCKVTPCSKEIRRDDGDGWATHEYALTLRVENRRRGYAVEFTANELEERLIPSVYSPFRRFGEFRNLFA